MPDCPETIDGAVVIFATVLDHARHRHTGSTRLFAETEQTWFHSLVIARYGRDSADSDVYLFYCNESWETENDSCYATIEEAVEEADRQLGVIRQDWKLVGWPFDQTRNTVCMSTRPVFDQGHPILFAQHFEDDHSWVFSCGTTNSTKDTMLVAMSTAFSRDPSIAFISDLKPGECAERTSIDSPWIRLPTTLEDIEP